MNYYEAANIRGKSFAQLMTDKLLAGQGVFSSALSARADRKAAERMVRKEKYDILNIARFLTGGSKLAPAVVGKLLGRSKEDIEYFSGKKKRSYQRQAPSYLERMYGKQSMITDEESVPVLQQILTILQKSESDRNIEYETMRMFQENQERYADDRHRDVMNVFIRAIRKRRREQMKAGKIPIKPPSFGLGMLGVGALALVGAAPAMAAARKPEEVKQEPSPPAMTEAPTPSLPVPTVVPETPAPPAMQVAPRVSPLSTIRRPTITPVDLIPPPATSLRYAERVARISIAGETSQTTREGAMKKAGQIVPNDPEPGQFSYGVFGMNTNGAIYKFVAENPQFGLTAKPGTNEFNQQWETLSQTRGKELYNAQLLWYEYNILEPLKKELATLLPNNLGRDARIVAYLADRRVQYGRTMENSAIRYSSVATTPEDFLAKMTEFDLQNIGKAFTTYLKNNPRNAQGLRNRINNRLTSAMAFDSGDMINDTSAENMRLRRYFDQETGRTVVMIRETNITSESLISVPTTIEEINPILR